MLFLLAAVAILLTYPAALLAQSAVPFERWAKAHAIDLPAPDSAGVAALEPLARVVGGARVVAFGEPAHDAHEPLAFRNRLFEFLVERMHFTAIALESGFTEAYRVYQYANGADGDLREVVGKGLTWGFGRHAENDELVAWIRRYNQDPSHSHKVHFYGMDLSGGDTDQLPQARRAVDFAVAYVARRDSALAATFATRFEPYLGRFSTPGYDSLSTRERVALTRLIAELRTSLTGLRPQTSDDDFDWASRSADVAEQLNRMFLLAPPAKPTAGKPRNISAWAAVRDSGMAENVRWALAREGPGAKIFVFAHRNHIMNSPITGGIWTPLHLTMRSLGVNLRRRFRDKLVIIGSAAAFVSGDLPPLEPDSTGLDTVLSRVGAAPFALDLRTARADAGAWAWLGRTRSIHSGITSHVDLVPRTAFDALVYLGTLSPARR